MAHRHLKTHDSISAAEALALGMVNKVVPRAELESATMEMAKLSINGAQDAGGREVAIKSALHLHQLAYPHNLKVLGMLIDPTGLPEATRKAMAARLAAPGERAEPLIAPKAHSDLRK